MSDIRNILEGVSDGTVSIDEELLKLKMKPFEDIGYAKVDMHRKLRQGAAEVIYGAGKTPEQIIGIADAMLKNGQKTILITRLSAEAAGIVSAAHPLQYHQDARCGVIVAIAGMEGALASVIGGLADCPVIAVPTSVGYGASFGGLSALLSMLNSCASGVSVVNIDNGFGAGYLASMINHISKK